MLSCSLGLSCLDHHLLGSSSVAEELGVASLERLVSLSGGLLNTTSVGFAALVVCGMVLRLRHCELCCFGLLNK